MKKIIVLCVMIIALGFVATGCGSGKAPAPTPAPPAADSHEGHDHGAEAADDGAL